MTIRTTLNPLNAVSNPYKQEEVLFESNTPGTYELKPKADCYAETTITGGGAGGAFNSSSNRSSAAAGSSASGCIVRVLLKAGKTYSITVGAGGNPSGGRDANTWGGVGGTSKITFEGKDLIIAPGGNGGHVWWPNAAAAATPPALCSFAENSELFSVIDVLMNRQGITGGTYTGNGGPSVIDGTTHGKGGKAVNSGGGSYAEAGNPGYIKIVNKRLKKKYKKYVFSTWSQPILTSDTSYGNTSCIGIREGQCQAYKALDGVKSGTPSTMQGWVSNTNTVGAWWMWKVPVILKINSIKFYNNHSSVNNNIFTAQFYADQSGTIPLSAPFTTIPGAYSVVDVPSIYDGTTDIIYFKCLSIQTGNVGIGELEINAQAVSGSIDGTNSDYDYITYEE